MRTKFQLELLGRLRRRKTIARAFTLVELMIVVAIVGILSAVAIPQFLGARAAAQAAAKVGEQLGLAKECSTFLSAGGIGTNPNASQCDTSSGGTYSASWTPAVSGLSCLGTTSSTAVSSVSIAISASGSMTCSLS